MTKMFALPLVIFACLLMSTGGCGGPTGGSVTENADQSAIDAYRAAQADVQVDPLGPNGPDAAAN